MTRRLLVFFQQKMMIRLTLSKSLMWSFRLPNDMRIFTNRRRISSLQPHFHEIGHLHPDSSIEASNILSLINHHYNFTFE